MCHSLAYLASISPDSGQTRRMRPQETINRSTCVQLPPRSPCSHSSYFRRNNPIPIQIRKNTRDQQHGTHLVDTKRLSGQGPAGRAAPAQKKNRPSSLPRERPQTAAVRPWFHCFQRMDGWNWPSISKDEAATNASTIAHNYMMARTRQIEQWNASNYKSVCQWCQWGQSVRIFALCPRCEADASGFIDQKCGGRVLTLPVALRLEWLSLSL